VSTTGIQEDLKTYLAAKITELVPLEVSKDREVLYQEIARLRREMDGMWQHIKFLETQRLRDHSIDSFW
jgi:hypothetical protein